ncbi:MAG: thioredoxin [Chlamydiia bacterium]|nr:thioredoxin [Chlamydiia bacterium]
MSQALKYLNDENFESTVKEGVTLVDFYADWCGPCRMIAPLIDELAEEMDGKAKVAKLNVEEATKVTADFGVTSIPTLIVFKNGEEVERIVGIKSKADLEGSINKALS